MATTITEPYLARSVGRVCEIGSEIEVEGSDTKSIAAGGAYASDVHVKMQYTLCCRCLYLPLLLSPLTSLSLSRLVILLFISPSPSLLFIFLPESPNSFCFLPFSLNVLFSCKHRTMKTASPRSILVLLWVVLSVPLSLSLSRSQSLPVTLTHIHTQNTSAWKLK